MLEVNLTYFRQTGKYYAEGLFLVRKETPLFEIWDMVADLRWIAQLPGLTRGHSIDYIVLIDVPEHPHRHPHLLI